MKIYNLTLLLLIISCAPSITYKLKSGYTEKINNPGNLCILNDSVQADKRKISQTSNIVSITYFDPVFPLIVYPILFGIGGGLLSTYTCKNEADNPDSFQFTDKFSCQIKYGTSGLLTGILFSFGATIYNESHPKNILGKIPKCKKMVMSNHKIEMTQSG